MKDKKIDSLGKETVLLASILLFSLLFFFSILCFIPATYSEGSALLLGAALILGLLLPTFFYVWSTVGGELSFLGNAPRLRGMPSLLLFSAGSFFLGVFLAELLTADGGALLFSRLPLPSVATPLSLATLTVYSFALAYLPFGLLYSYLAPKGTLISLFAAWLLFAALSFSFESLPWFLIFGLLLAMMRWQSGTFLAPFFGMLCLSLGGWGAVTGLLDAQRLGGLSEDVFLLVAGISAIVLLLLAQSVRFWRRVGEHFVSHTDKKELLVWILFSLIALGVSLLLTVLF